VDGKLAFALKNHIDKGFMKKYQVSGELTEEDEGRELNTNEHH
jgi:hypothetical protein